MIELCGQFIFRIQKNSNHFHDAERYVLPEYYESLIIQVTLVINK